MFSYTEPIDRRFGITSVVCGVISLVFCSVGIALPTWYVARDQNNEILSTANYFYTCFIENGTSMCASYSSYRCVSIVNDESGPGCENPHYSLIEYGSPVSHVPMGDIQRLRSAAGLSIMGIIFIFFAVLLTLLMSIILIHQLFTFIPPLAFFLAGLSLMAALADGSGALKCSETGFILFVTGILLTWLALLFSAFTAGRLHLSARNQ
ncbi:unnamed protein product [Didymodactylos carnosus]|uniref:Uncharacterized protein n=1 Tax=Didymodactylos carnosus TaxID=1234261 RepID=A0A8S2E1K5_9BILA|nr:unnamed protein product [Didymodactylos carnosus]CAF3794042.1 unnamed protein product [Didymodactylos carnosus]